MRMWNIPVLILCKNHFLGEHNEMHKFIGSLNHGHSISGYVKKGFVEVHNIRKRHDLLVSDFARRGYNHDSSLPFFEVFEAGKIDVLWNLHVLLSRCFDCLQNFKKYYSKLDFPLKVFWMDTVLYGHQNT